MYTRLFGLILIFSISLAKAQAPSVGADISDARRDALAESRRAPVIIESDNITLVTPLEFGPRVAPDGLTCTPDPLSCLYISNGLDDSLAPLTEAVQLKNCSCFMNQQSGDDTEGISAMARVCGCYDRQINVSSLLKTTVRTGDLREDMLNEGAAGFTQIFDGLLRAPQMQAIGVTKNKDIVDSYSTSRIFTEEQQRRQIAAQMSADRDSQAGRRIDGIVDEIKDLAHATSLSVSTTRDDDREASKELTGGYNRLVGQVGVGAVVVQGISQGAVTGTTGVRNISGADRSVSSQDGIEIQPMSDEDFSSLIASDLPESRTPDQCLTMQQYNRMQRVPDDQEFYKSLDRTLQSPPQSEEQWATLSQEWDLQKLLMSLEDEDNLYTTKALEITAKVKFIFSNPSFANVLASSFVTDDPAGNIKKIQAKQKVLGFMQKYFNPSNCNESEMRNYCVARNLRNSTREEQELLSDPNVIDAAREASANRLPKLSDYFLRPGNDNIAYLLDIPSKRRLRYSLSISAEAQKPEVIGEACQRVKSLQDPDQVPALIRDQDEQKIEIADFLRKVANSVNPNKTENESYQLLNRRVCQTRRCLDPSKACEGSNLQSFSEYYSSQRNSPCRNKTGPEAESCWGDKMDDFFKSTRDYVPQNNGIRIQLADSSDFYRQFLNPTAEQARNVNHRGFETQTKASAATEFPPPRSDIRSGASDDIVVVAPRRVRSAQSQIASARIAQASTSEASSRTEASQTGSTSPGGVSGSSTPSIASRTPASMMTSDTMILPQSYNFTPEVGVTPEIRAAVTRDVQSSRIEATDARDSATALATQVVNTTDDAERARLQAQIDDLTRRASEADNRASDLERRLSDAVRAADEAKARKSARTADGDDSDSDNSRVDSSSGNRVAQPVTGQPAPTLAAPLVPQIGPNGAQTLGAGSTGGVSLPPVTIGRSNGRSSAVNLNFKYGSDAKSASTPGTSGGIVVAGDSSAFISSDELGAVVNSAPAVDIGSIGQEDARLLSSRDPATLERYRAQYSNQISQQSGNVLRLVYSTGGTSREIVIVKGSNGQIFVPAARDLAGARARASLAGMRAVLGQGN